jgi:hypothetical protein
MSTRQWYRAHLRWAIMVRSSQGLRRWEDSVFVFLSEDHETATARALHYGRQREGARGEGRQNVEKRLAEIVSLDCLGTDQSEFEVELGAQKPRVRLPFEHLFDPAGRSPPPSF